MHRVLHRVHGRAQPHRHAIAAQAFRQVRLLGHGTVGHMAREKGLHIGAQKITHMAPHTIGRDQHIGAALAMVFGEQFHGADVLADAGHCLRQMHLRHALCLHRVVQQSMQIDTGHRGVARAIALHRPGAQGQSAH